MKQGVMTLVWIVLAAALPSCSKENDVDTGKTTTGIGGQCSGPGDTACGTSGVCVLGYCRLGCQTDLECPQGALCLGDTPPYGCSLQSELDCKADPTACHAPLACSLDGKCRFGCKATTDCPRNEHVCVTGVCVSKSEPGAKETWLACTDGVANWSTATHCLTDPMAGVDQLENCNVTAPGWTKVKDCRCMGNWGPTAPEPPKRIVGWCACELVDSKASCDGAKTDCLSDTACSACLFEKYVPECDNNTAYKALTQCGCVTTVPAGTTCAQCVHNYSSCEGDTGNVPGYTECVENPTAPECKNPGVAEMFDCPCKPAGCASACKEQCTATGH